jgi:hypothetical protein
MVGYPSGRFVCDVVHWLSLWGEIKGVYLHVVQY